MTIDSRVLHGITGEMCPEFSFFRKEFAGENPESYWKSIFDFKCQNTSKERYLRGISKEMGF